MNLGQPDNSMERYSKYNCQYREHQNYDTPARCYKFIELAKADAQFHPSVCRYCIDNNADLSIANEPFKSQYNRLVKRNKLNTFNNADCIMLGEHSNNADIQEYLNSPTECNYYNECVVNRNCITCKNKIKGIYEFNQEPDYSVFGSMQKYGSVEKWAIGVITAPRNIPTLTKTIKSISNAGWNNGIIFAEPGIYEQHHNWKYCYRSEKIGIFGNWMLGLYELFIRNIDADAFIMIQDDIILPPGLKKYLENSLWFTDNDHIVSLFTPASVSRDQPDGWHKTSEYNGGPAVIVMSHGAVRKILSSTIPLQFYGAQKTSNSSFDDLGIFLIDNLEVYYPIPSISDHIGHISTHCKQLPVNIQPSRTLCNHQYIDVEHWFITDNRCGRDISDLKLIMSNIENANWLIINHDDDTHTIKCDTEWIMTTRLPIGTKILSDVREQLIRQFVYREEWFNFGYGEVDGNMVYTKDGPLLTLCERSANMKTCLVECKEAKIINSKQYWSYATR